MASTPYVIFVLSLTSIIPFAFAEDCDSYTDYRNIHQPSRDCSFLQYCCGSCDNRYCCSSVGKRLHEDTCLTWESNGDNIVSVVSGIAGLVVFIILIISCCVCPCCCLYKMCRKPTPVVATTTVVQAAYPPPPSASQAYQGVQYPGYQPVPVQPGYGGQPMPTAPYQGQPQPFSPGYQGQASGPPPPYQEAGPGYPPPQAPYSHAGYSAGQMAYPLQPPTQPGYPPQPDCSTTQPAYNPAYVEPPKTGY